ncbi:glycosyltransferase [Sporomusa sp.]|uniref:glycosyltransferase n=1 Tax=Sporomusa sp. TaxID=2078658 RepID=UPI002C6E9712|nr:glycosyltransferase [Sporomusa sp.]HWR45117.1 glycosyltransferase [Sporomusa sp.]
MSNKISLCMIVKNEEINLARCLHSVAGAVDEIIIVDTGSSDQTIQVAEHAGAQVIAHIWQDDFSAARNVSLELATGDWILFLDADETLEPGTAQALRQVAESDTDGYFVKIINLIGVEGSIETCPDLVFRMFRNKPEYRFRGTIHEQIVDVILEKNRQAKFQIAENIVLRHYGYLTQQIIEKDKKNRNLSIIKKQMESDPDNNTLRYHYGVELYRIDNFTEAAEELTKAANNTDPSTIYYPKLLRYIVLAHCGAQQYDRALEAISLALKFFPNYADLYYYGGLIHLEQKNYAGAFDCFQNALSMPEQPAYYAPFSGSRGFRAYYQIARLAEAFGNEEEALRYYILSLQDNPGFTITLSAIVRILNPRKDPEYTKQAMEKLCDFCTTDAKRLIGTVYFTEGAYRLALDYFEKIEPADIDDYTSMLKAICLIQQKRILEAMRLLDAIPLNHPQYPLARMNEILCFWLNKNRTKVRVLCENFLAVGLSADTGAVVIMLKDSLYKRGSAPPAVLGLEGMSLVKDIVLRALDLQELQLAEGLLAKVAKSTQKEYALDLARIFAHYEYWDTAKLYTELYLEEHPDNADAWCLMGEILRQSNQSEEACLCYRRALSIAPQQPQYYVKLIRLYQAMRQELLFEAARKYPDMPLFRELLEEAAKQ